MFPILTAIVPVFMLLALGWGLRLKKFPGDEFWDYLDPVVYYILFPALLVRNFANVDLGELTVLPAGIAAIVTMVVAASVLLVARRRLTIDGPGFAAMLQGTVRFNAYLGFAVSAQLYGNAGLTLFSVVIAFVTPMANVISVYGLTRYGSRGEANFRRLAMALASNPLILSVLGGVTLNVSGIGLPWVLDPFCDVLGRAALPLGLLAAGAGLDLGAIRQAGGAVATTCVLRLVAMPALALGITTLLGVDGLAQMCVLLYAVMPVPPGAYILARQLGGDARLTAAIISASTMAALFTIPLWLTGLGLTGLG
jgi:predicted permease